MAEVVTRSPETVPPVVRGVVRVVLGELGAFDGEAAHEL
jgi:hypothetical protein